jgi:hypothetical protein
MDTLHVLVGICLQFAVAFILRMPVTRWIPWLVVLAIEVANEWSDLRAEKWPDPGMQYGAGAKDILLTMALPTLILLVSRFKGGILVRSTTGQHKSINAPFREPPSL